MYRVPPARAWWPAVGAPLERGVRLHRVLKPSLFRQVSISRKCFMDTDCPESGSIPASRAQTLAASVPVIGSCLLPAPIKNRSNTTPAIIKCFLVTLVGCFGVVAGAGLGCPQCGQEFAASETVPPQAVQLVNLPCESGREDAGGAMAGALATHAGHMYLPPCSARTDSPLAKNFLHAAQVDGSSSRVMSRCVVKVGVSTCGL